MKSPTRSLRVALTSLIVACAFVILFWGPSTLRGESSMAHEGYCCPQDEALCIVNCHIRNNAYAVTEMQNCPSYPLVYVEGGPCPGENPW